jgi:hypothetical protein
LIAKRKPSPDEGGEGSKIAIVFNGSPLFTGDAASGESNIRRWIIENEWLDAIVALPDQLFYNTGIRHSEPDGVPGGNVAGTNLLDKSEIRAHQGADRRELRHGQEWRTPSFPR